MLYEVITLADMRRFGDAVPHFDYEKPQRDQYHACRYGVFGLQENATHVVLV